MQLIRRLLDEDPLPADAEQRLARAARDGDPAAREALLRSGSRLVALRVLATGFAPDEADDAFQAGFLALVDAVDRFDPDRGARLATYAWPWLTHALARHRRRPPETVTDVLPESGVLDPHDVGDASGRLWSAVAGLAPAERAAVEARFATGPGEPCPRAWEVVAAHLEVSPATARRRVGRALSRLRGSLGRVCDRAPVEGADPP